MFMRKHTTKKDCEFQLQFPEKGAAVLVFVYAFFFFFFFVVVHMNTFNICNTIGLGWIFATTLSIKYHLHRKNSVLCTCVCVCVFSSFYNTFRADEYGISSEFILCVCFSGRVRANARTYSNIDISDVFENVCSVYYTIYIQMGLLMYLHCICAYFTSSVVSQIKMKNLRNYFSNLVDVKLKFLHIYCRMCVCVFLLSFWFCFPFVLIFTLTLRLSSIPAFWKYCILLYDFSRSVHIVFMPLYWIIIAKM